VTAANAASYGYSQRSDGSWYLNYGAIHNSYDSFGYLSRIGSQSGSNPTSLSSIAGTWAQSGPTGGQLIAQVNAEDANKAATQAVVNWVNANVAANSTSTSVTAGDLVVKSFIDPGSVSPSLALMSPVANPSTFLTGTTTELVGSFTTQAIGFVGLLLIPTPTGSGDTLDQPLQATNTNAPPSFNQLYHYTQPENVISIQATGLWPNSWATDNPFYTPTQAQQLLALPNPDPPTVIIPIQTDPTQYIGPMPVDPTDDPVRSGGGVQYHFPIGVPPRQIGQPIYLGR